jgi:TRAP-type uncharacterized transport system fused permease subunit
MTYSPLLLNGSVKEIVLAVVTGIVGLFAFAVAIEGHWLVRTTIVKRVAMVVATVLLLTPSYARDAVGAAVVAVAVFAQVRRARPSREATTGPAAHADLG